MNQIPEAIWQEIAQEANLRHPESKAIFQAGDLGAEAWSQTTDELPDLQNKIKVAIEEIGPNYLENQAIQKWINQDEAREGLRQALPELPTIQVALALMERELRLSQGQIQRLQAFLQSDQLLTVWRKTANSLKLTV